AEANPPLPSFPGGEYVLQEISSDELSTSVKHKQFLHIDQAECIMCEGCVDICPWKCIHMLSNEAVADVINTTEPGLDPDDHVIFVVDEDVCTRCGLCVDRWPTGVTIMGTVGVAPREGDGSQPDHQAGES